MSKIIIKEQDLTTSPVGAYANFTVLVPGYYDPEKYDEKTKAPFYGEYAREFSSQDEFVQAIGKVAAQNSALEAEYCKLTPVSFETTGGTVESRTLPAGKTFYQRAENPISGSEPPSKGYLVMEFEGDGEGSTYYEITPFVSDGVGIISAPGQDEKPNIFVLKDGDDTAEFIYDDGAFDGNTLGSDAQVAYSYGNQFAYELLGLGYTVLYADLGTLIEQTGDGEGKLSSIFEPFKDKAAYDFRYILTGFFNSGIAGGDEFNPVAFNADAAKLANDRGDCIALCDLNADEYLNPNLVTIGQKVNCIKKLAEGFTDADKYTALFANRPTYNISYSADDVYTNKTFSGGFHYLACAAKANRRYAEWFAVAGYTRGISDFVIDKLDINLGDPAVDTLQGRNGNDCQKAVNIMVKVRNQYYLWGNRTAQTLDPDTDGQDTLTASHFLNIRQLCTTIKKQVYTTCRALTFNPNSDTLWLDYTHRITPTLDYAKTNQGLRTYTIEQVKNNKKAKLTSIIRIVPIEAVEDFEITLSLEDSISGSGNINISESAAQ